MCDDTITSVYFVSTDDDNVFLLKPKSVYDTNEKYCYVDTVVMKTILNVWHHQVMTIIQII